MARNLTALKVKIGLAPVTGHAQYPAFNILAVVQASGLDWSKYVDVNGEGWKYDNVVGHKEEDADSPFGMQWGILVIDQTFADEAVTAFPTMCERMTEAECTTFYDERHAVSLPSVKRDEEVLTALTGERARLAKATADTTAIDAEIVKAEDPDDPTSGVRRVKEKTWVGLKSKSAIVYQEPQVGRTRIPVVR